MSIRGPYVHDIDPIIGSIFDIHLWWYGSAYALGFLVIFASLRNRREALGFSVQTVYALAILVAVGVLTGGRFIQVAFYEWPFYREYPHLIPAYWLGGMATHGLLLGAVAGIGLFCWAWRSPFLPVADALAVPAAIILGVGRLGNFVDGQIVGGVTDVWWAFKFPDADGFRHPVVLYDSIKNFLLIPVLLAVDKRRLGAGVATGLFLFLYAFLRLFVDLFREYPTSLLGLATGQFLNIALSAIGLILLVWSLRRGGAGRAGAVDGRTAIAGTRAFAFNIWWGRAAFGALLLFSLTIPSDWTQDIPDRYAKRHPGLQHSALYLPINAYRQKMQRLIRPGAAKAFARRTERPMAAMTPLKRVKFS